MKKNINNLKEKQITKEQSNITKNFAVQQTIIAQEIIEKDEKNIKFFTNIKKIYTYILLTRSILSFVFNLSFIFFNSVQKPNK